ncbi:ATP-grasp domain-containing protein [Paraliomyxa miuraensis]|uniref:hypothetical protein n=1 Tax=Paraliomyxa miuraensis TaxID=376150 RepID=UPI0022584460|nr:hypothetical protein [Paraliomyxa miuraensis]MCX4240521.1 hypothetical protein [Paraliomyxa miuraensis]
MASPVLVKPGEFDPQKHFYERVLNAQIHPLVRFFFNLGNERIAERYCHLHPEADAVSVRRILGYTPSYFRWGGADLFVTSNRSGQRRIVIIETNSCPSGQKSMPLIAEADEMAGYRLLVEHTFLDMMNSRALPPGELAVLYDKNLMEASGYAATIAELTREPVHLVPYHDGDMERTARFTESRTLEVCSAEGQWVPIRAAMRYVTQRPWNRLPPVSRTPILNPAIACLAGGRNKLVAAKAYDLLNAKLAKDGLKIHVPETIWDASRAEVPLWIERMGGLGVIKNPYSNAGQGVYTITSRAELERFMDSEQHYDQFIVQALIGNSSWSAAPEPGRLYHVGTVPDRKGDIYVADLRCMAVAGKNGFRPIAIYARRARTPLTSSLSKADDSWDMLGTNLSYKKEDGTWSTQTDRLLLMDGRDFNRLGLGLDDLIEAYLQTVMAMISIDEMCGQLVNKAKKFRRKLFESLNRDDKLSVEIFV